MQAVRGMRRKREGKTGNGDIDHIEEDIGFIPHRLRGRGDTGEDTMMTMTDTDTPEGSDEEIETMTNVIIRGATDRIPVREVVLHGKNGAVVGGVTDTLGPRHAPALDLLGGTKRTVRAVMATAALANTGPPIDINRKNHLPLRRQSRLNNHPQTTQIPWKIWWDPYRKKEMGMAMQRLSALVVEVPINPAQALLMPISQKTMTQPSTFISITTIYIRGVNPLGVLYQGL